MRAQRAIIAQLVPQVTMLKEGFHEAHDAVAASAKERKLAYSALPQQLRGYVDASSTASAMQDLQNQLTTHQRWKEDHEDNSVPFQAPAGLHAAALGRRLAVDLLKLTSTEACGADISPQTKSTWSHGTWQFGSLTVQEGSALIAALSAMLQTALSGVLYKTDGGDGAPDAYRQVRQQFPELPIIPVPTSQAPPQGSLQQFQIDGSLPVGLLGFVSDALTVKPREMQLPKSSLKSLNVDSAAIRRVLPELCDGAVAFHTKDQAERFATDQIIRLRPCPPILALDQPQGLLRVRGVCQRLPAAEAVAADHVDIGLLEFKNGSLLGVYVFEKERELSSQLDLLQQLKVAEDAYQVKSDLKQVAERALADWSNKNHATLDAAQAATGVSKKRKTSAQTPAGKRSKR